MIVSATISITANVNRYSVSDTANVKYGGTQMKSNRPTPTTDAATAGPRPVRAETHTTAIRYSIAMLVISM